MRKIKTLLLVGLAFWYAAEGFAQRGIGTNLPDRSSVLHLESGTRGLLIPQINLTNGTLDPAPVINPANSLLIYNTATIGDVGEDEIGVRPGYYYWKYNNPGDKTLGGQWIPLLNTAGNNIEIDDNGVVSVKPGELAGQVLVTVEVDGELTSKWVNISEILEDLFDIDGTNGIEVIPVPADIDPITGAIITPPSFIVKIDGDLTENTIITTNAGDPNDPDNNDISFSIESSGNQFFITNLNEIKVNDDGTITGTGTSGDPGTPGDTFKDFFDVLIVDKDTGLVQRVSVEDLLKDAIAVKNGLHYDPTDGFIKLGGDLTQPTEIKLQESNDLIITRGETLDSNEPDVTNPGEFKIVGLEETASNANLNQILVLDELNNVKTVRRVISKDITESVSVEASDPTTDYIYSPYVQEVNITVSGLLTVTADIDLTLPAANAANEGQVINVSLTNETEPTTHTHALVIKDSSGADVTWGALPFQGWVLKSDGSKWRVVSSN